MVYFGKRKGGIEGFLGKKFTRIAMIFYRQKSIFLQIPTHAEEATDRLTHRFYLLLSFG